MATSLVAFPSLQVTNLVEVFRFDDYTPTHFATITLPSGWTFAPSTMAFSAKGKYLAMGNATQILIYERVGYTFTLLQTITATNNNGGISWRPDETAFVVASQSTAPRLRAYAFNGTTFVARTITGTIPATGIVGINYTQNHVTLATASDLYFYTVNADGDLTYQAARGGVFSPSNPGISPIPFSEVTHFATGLNLISTVISGFTFNTEGLEVANQTGTTAGSLASFATTAAMIARNPQANVAASQVEVVAKSELGSTSSLGRLFSNHTVANTTIVPLNFADRVALVTRSNMPYAIIVKMSADGTTMAPIGQFPPPSFRPSQFAYTPRQFATTLHSVAPTISLYNAGLAPLVTNPSGIALKLMLLSAGSTFNASHTTMAQVLSGNTEISGNGWPVGGANVTGVEVETVSGNVILTADSVGANISGGSISASKAVIYQSGTNIPIAFIDFGATYTANSGERLSLEFDDTGVVAYFPG